jgi:hypothetical protein
MKKLISILSGLFIIALSIAVAYLGAKMFDASGRLSITPFVFQPDNLSRDRERIGRPLALESVSDEFVRNRLITKFINEYYYAIPDQKNLEHREGAYGVLKYMASDSIYKAWKKNVVPEIMKISIAGGMRRVIIDEIPKDPKGDYYVAVYRTVTWNKSNRLAEIPIISEPKTMYIKLDYFKKALRVDSEGRPLNIKKFLKEGYDPSLMFRFKVDDIRIFGEHGEVKQ